ncbi:MAG: hypothetical protein Q9187_008901 [Circinaria calcarea]
MSIFDPHNLYSTHLHLLTFRRAKNWLQPPHGPGIEVRNDGFGTTSSKAANNALFSERTVPTVLTSARTSSAAPSFFQKARLENLSSARRTLNSNQVWKKAVIFLLAVAKFRAAGKAHHLSKAKESQQGHANPAVLLAVAKFKAAGKAHHLSKIKESHDREAIQAVSGGPGYPEAFGDLRLSLANYDPPWTAPTIELVSFDAKQEVGNTSQHREHSVFNPIPRSADEPWSPNIPSASHNFPGSSVFSLDGNVKPYRASRRRRLDPKDREHAQKMRRIGACADCRMKKVKCTHRLDADLSTTPSTKQSSTNSTPQINGPSPPRDLDSALPIAIESPSDPSATGK